MYVAGDGVETGFPLVSLAVGEKDDAVEPSGLQVTAHLHTTFHPASVQVRAAPGVDPGDFGLEPCLVGGRCGGHDRLDDVIEGDDADPVPGAELMSSWHRRSRSWGLEGSKKPSRT